MDLATKRTTEIAPSSLKLQGELCLFNIQANQKKRKKKQRPKKYEDGASDVKRRGSCSPDDGASFLTHNYVVQRLA